MEPFYFYDGTNDYRKINARFLEQFSSTDRDDLLKEIIVTKDALVAYLKTIPESEWELDTGIVHYRGNPATIARCVDSLVRDYPKHRQEILDGLCEIKAHKAGQVDLRKRTFQPPAEVTP